MIPDFKVKTRPQTDLSYEQKTHVDAHGRMVLEFIPGDAMKGTIHRVVDQFIGVDSATADVNTPQGPATANMNLRFPILAASVSQAFEMFDNSAQQELDRQMVEVRKQALAHPGAVIAPRGNGG